MPHVYHAVSNGGKTHVVSSTDKKTLCGIDRTTGDYEHVGEIRSGKTGTAFRGAVLAMEDLCAKCRLAVVNMTGGHG